MRLWHYELIKYLPDSQLLAQWRELNAIFRAGIDRINHILINYVKEYEHPKDELYAYGSLVIDEIRTRGLISNISYKNWNEFFSGDLFLPAYQLRDDKRYVPFKKHHTERYLLQCFYNLQEKYDRGQKDFSLARYAALEEFVLGKEKK